MPGDAWHSTTSTWALMSTMALDMTAYACSPDIQSDSKLFSRQRGEFFRLARSLRGATSSPDHSLSFRLHQETTNARFQ